MNAAKLKARETFWEILRVKLTENEILRLKALEDEDVLLDKELTCFTLMSHLLDDKDILFLESFNQGVIELYSKTKVQTPHLAAWIAIKKRSWLKAHKFDKLTEAERRVWKTDEHFLWFIYREIIVAMDNGSTYTLTNRSPKFGAVVFHAYGELISKPAFQALPKEYTTDTIQLALDLLGAEIRLAQSTISQFSSATIEDTSPPESVLVDRVSGIGDVGSARSDADGYLKHAVEGTDFKADQVSKFNALLHHLDEDEKQATREKRKVLRKKSRKDARCGCMCAEYDCEECIEYAETVFRNINMERKRSLESVASEENQSPDKSTVVGGPDESYAAEDEQEISYAVEEEEYYDNDDAAEDEHDDYSEEDAEAEHEDSDAAAGSEDEQDEDSEDAAEDEREDPYVDGESDDDAGEEYSESEEDCT